MRTRYSLRFKVALVFSALTILLLAAQALGVKTLAEAQEEKFIVALVADDMKSLIQTYSVDPTLVPPLDPRLGGYVSQESRAPVALPISVKNLSNGTHEIIVNDREIHVGIAPYGSARIYRIYDFSAYEQHFKKMINVLMIGTGMFALLTIWLAFALSGLLVRQLASFARQVKALSLGASTSLISGKYDEIEVVDLVDAFNDYHRKMGRMIAREKEFTSNVSHEFRTPLTAIKTSCELLDQDPVIRSKSKTRLRQIDRAVDNMIELVNALLLLAREESLAAVGHVCLVDAVRDALAPFADVLAAKGINAVVDLNSQLHVQVNQSALAIVLSNLIDNAIKHTDHGEVRFTCPKDSLRIEDTGCGIPPDALPHVFERFYRVNPAQAGDCGFGMGLSIVKKFCDRYQWRIRIDSQAGQGTRVSLHLPFAG